MRVPSPGKNNDELFSHRGSLSCRRCYGSSGDAGSWDPKNAHWGGKGGRVYATALGALCLEVYYRYSEALNSFGAAPDLDELVL
ncbi:MAG: hypothetical protein VB835_09625 [Pirellulales bacterium]